MITQEQADAISRILAEEYETNPAFREVVDARAARLASSPSLTPGAEAEASGRRRRSTPLAGAATPSSGEAA